MAQLYQTALLSVLALVIPRATTYSTGAPAEGCWSERPLHRDYLPQGGAELPYQITTNVTSYGPSQTIMVTISSPAARLDHRGFLLRVVTSSGRRGGRWAVDRSLQRYNPECGVTHSDPRSRSVTTVLWRSPSSVLGSLGNIQFKAIVVANMSVFWDNILSHSISPVYPDVIIIFISANGIVFSRNMSIITTIVIFLISFKIINININIIIIIILIIIILIIILLLLIIINTIIIIITIIISEANNVKQQHRPPSSLTASIATARRYQRIFDLFDGASDKTTHEKQATKGVKPPVPLPAAIGNDLDNDVRNLTSNSASTASPVMSAQ
ncbi:serine protease [Elysia marginata]|uniref:Serine protease n=1 Tax=Elysia marginata TaxID=1093978 RepID=A0AAV4GQX5_9GAST|nr:serine protease [Elysia marginata]